MVIAIVFSGCAATSVKYDSINATRGAPSAQVSEPQAKQYDRQRQLESNEVRLENMKRIEGIFKGGNTGNLIDIDTIFSDTAFK